MIQTYVPGESLLVRWNQAGDTERDEYISQLAMMLRRLHSVRLSGYGDPSNPRLNETWSVLHARRASHALQAAREAGNAEPALLDEAERALVRDSAGLSGGYPTLTHGDLHFGNIHVDHGKITGLLDFERAWAATPDWDLDQLIRFVHYPNIFASTTAEHAVHPADLVGVIPALHNDYPDLFAFNSLPSRLRVYALEYELRALVSVRKRHGNNPEVLRAVEARIHNTLSPAFPGI
jgi:aminoglycoside phosphotransferase (APT) family kinase protein